MHGDRKSKERYVDYRRQTDEEKLGGATYDGKEEIESLLKVGMADLTSPPSQAFEPLFSLTINSVIVFDGDQAGRKAVKIDAAMPNVTAERLRRSAGTTPLLAMTCAYDTAAKAVGLENDQRVPSGNKIDGSVYTRQEAW